MSVAKYIMYMCVSVARLRFYFPPVRTHYIYIILATLDSSPSSLFLSRLEALLSFLFPSLWFSFVDSFNIDVCSLLLTTKKGLFLPLSSFPPALVLTSTTLFFKSVCCVVDVLNP